MAKGPRAGDERRDAKGRRKLIARVLIICEGKKTEPLYLSDLRDELKAPTVSFEVVGEGRDPSAVVKRAIEHAESVEGDYDYIFCVFDRDKHARYADACERCKTRRVKRQGAPNTKLVAITTNPSFEYWLLLHLNPTTRPYRQTGTKTSGDQVLSEFAKEYLRATGQKYSKGSRGVYKALRAKLDTAIDFSEKANRDGLGNPHSLVGAMITAMRNISTGKEPRIDAIEKIPRANESA